MNNDKNILLMKCGFCPYSHLRNGKLYCRHNCCVLGSSEIKEMLNILGGIK